MTRPHKKPRIGSIHQQRLYLAQALPVMPVTNFSTPEKYQYLNGFQSYHE